MDFKPIIKTENLKYKYELGNLALDNVSVNIEKGKITGVLGGNGSGKTTLFLHLNGILKPMSGKVFFENRAFSYKKKDLINLKKNIGVVFQEPDNQIFSSSVYEDISFGPMNLSLPVEEVKKRVDYAIEKTKISEIVDRPVHMLSFGQKKRVAIAGVLAMKPKVIVMDEPTAGLDPMGASEIMRFLLELKKESNLTVVIATHDIDMVPVYCDYIYIMDKAKVKSYGKCDEIFENPETLRECNLRLPRIGHLMEILKNKDNLNVNISDNTISKSRKAIKNLVKE
jgi:cobalt/nickel transport system ATP-binding protein